MKTLGQWIMVGSVLVLAIGLFVYFVLSKPSESETVLLNAAQSSADLCMATKRLDRYDGGFTDCADDLDRLEERASALAKRASTYTMPGLILMGSGPFLFLVGLILFVGGRQVSHPHTPPDI